MAQYDPAMKRVMLVFRPRRETCPPKAPNMETVYEKEAWCFAYYDGNYNDAVIRSEERRVGKECRL